MRSAIIATVALASAACESAPVRIEDGIAAIPVAAAAETAPMIGRGDRADDPAVWVDATDPAKSLILGTNKEEGLHVYDLSGAQLQMLPVGRLNNIDVRGPLAVGSNDETNSLSWFRRGAGAEPLVHVADTPTNKIEPYGVCAGMVDGAYYAAPTYKDGQVQLWRLDDLNAVTLQPVLARTIQLGGQLEGCVFDDDRATLFIGEEEHGIWSVDLSDPNSSPVSVDTIAAGHGLVADVEGISLWLGEEGAGYLVASAQAADRFVLYDRASPHAPRGVVRIVGSADGAIDPVSHTDGLDVTSAPLPGYPRGLMVVQDDGNPASGVDQNFKLVDWSRVEAALGLPN